MGNHILLNGQDWSLTGWNRNQWKSQFSMETGLRIPPLVPLIPATVPGSVQDDLRAAGWLPDPNKGLRSLELEWVNNRDWTFEKNFELPIGWMKSRCELVFEGLDDKGEIYVNGIHVAAFEGMFTTVRIDITSCLKEEGINRLMVAFVHSPEVDGQVGYSNRISKLKSRFNYGWDWCPRIVPIGIWRDVYLSTCQDLQINDFYPDASLAECLEKGDIHCQINLDSALNQTYLFEYRVEDEEGRLLYNEACSRVMTVGNSIVNHSIALNGLKPWWPNGYGKQTIYTVHIDIKNAAGNHCDEASRTIGFRRIEFIQNEEAPEQALPYTLIMNGKRIFLKGINWVPISPFYGSIEQNHYNNYLGQFKAMNVNLIRVWGGAIVEKKAFYEYCDRNGLMVWQEFLQSSSGLNNCPPEEPEFLNQLDILSRSAVIEKRNHPCLIIWCGGNELMWDDYRPVNEEHLNIALLKGIVEELDPKRYFLPASASGPSFCESEANIGKGMHHDVHGPWNYLGDETHYRFFNQMDSLFRSESGTPGMSRVRILEDFSEGLSLWPPTEDNPYWLHRGSLWIQWDQLNELFGNWDIAKNEIYTYSQASRYLQMESMRYMVESTRRREPRNSGFIVWMGNEPFANNVNTSLIEYDGTPKPAYYALKRAFSQLYVSAKYDKISYSSGELYTCDIYAHDEQFILNPIESKVRVKLLQADGTIIKQVEYSMSHEKSGVSVHLGHLDWIVEPVVYQIFMLRIECIVDNTRVITSNEYIFSVDSLSPFEPIRRLPKSHIILRQGMSTKQIIVSNPSTIVAAGIFAIPKVPEDFIHLDSNYFNLLPGEEVTISSGNKDIKPADVYFEGLNFHETTTFN